jgi:chitinase
LPARLIVGYWHNFNNGSAYIPLSGVPSEYDVIDVAFAEPTTFLGSTMAFTPDPGLYSNSQGFISDVTVLQSKGKKVLISIGGANGPIQIKSVTDVQNFVASMKSIINFYGFDGVDIDLEGSSLSLQQGDNDFRSPVTPGIVFFITAIQQLLLQFPNGLLLTAAPETAFVQGGAGAYSGVFGAYLPIIHALRNQLTFIHVQHYNSGSMFGRDGELYQPATADFHVAMADMLIAGFKVRNNNTSISFPPLPQEKVLIGLPASVDAAGSGYTPDAALHAALTYLYTGQGFGGHYTLASATGYPGFRGVMTWSINWDLFHGQVWSKSQRNFLDNVIPSTAVAEKGGPDLAGGQPTLEQNYPNPFNPGTAIRYTLRQTTGVSLDVFDVLGRKVTTLVDGIQAPGNYEVRFDGRGVASGVYFYTLRTGEATITKMLHLMR